MSQRSAQVGIQVTTVVPNVRSESEPVMPVVHRREGAQQSHRLLPPLAVTHRSSACGPETVGGGWGGGGGCGGGSSQR